MTTIAIIGAGFSGMILALNLFERGAPQDRLILIEKRSDLGLGQAYSTQDPTHLLNIPATGMSPFSQAPNAFAEFLKANRALVPPDIASLQEFYAPRLVYGHFLKHLVETRLKPSPGRPQLMRLQGIASEILDTEHGLTVALADGRSVPADRVVLAAGNLPPAPLSRIAGFEKIESAYVGDPWAGGGLDAIKPEATILLIGSGLTTLDYVQSLAARGHRGSIVVVSRHGLLPRRHEPTTSWPAFIETADTGSVRKLVRLVRQQIKAAESQGQNWQSVLNSLRPFSQALWAGLSAREQARFIRHIRPYWDVHRHRVAPAVAERVAALAARGQLQVIAGSIQKFQKTETGIDIAIRPRGTNATLAVTAQQIVNCSGPNYDFASADETMLRRLLERGRISLNHHRLGLSVGTNYATINRNGQVDGDLFAMGPMLRGQYWEINAVAEIVAQAETMAAYLWATPQPVQTATKAAAG